MPCLARPCLAQAACLARPRHARHARPALYTIRYHTIYFTVFIFYSLYSMPCTLCSVLYPVCGMLCIAYCMTLYVTHYLLFVHSVPIPMTCGKLANTATVACLSTECVKPVCNLREFVRTSVILTPAREGGRFRAAVRGPDNRDNRDSRDPRAPTFFAFFVIKIGT